MTSPSPRPGPAHESHRRPGDHVLILFGATGDLAKRKLLPGLFHLAEAGLMPDRYRVVGTARRPITDKQFREQAREAVAEFGSSKPDGAAWTAFAQALSFGSSAPGDTLPLESAVQRAEADLGGAAHKLIHLAIPPVAFESTVTMLGRTGLASGARVIVEKPFGTDLASARALNHTLHQVFDESRIFRIDHFLGKESVDNILAFRFANGLFEPIWNRQHISYVQIDVPESLSIEGRAGFYDQTGAYSDMIVTHLFQVLGFVAMEPPTSLGGQHLRQEKDKVFDALRPLSPEHVVRGQYEGYRSEPGVAPDSDTETLAAVRTEIDNWRWKGVPFLLRSGKSLAASRQVVTLGFHEPPLHMFPVHHRDAAARRGNELVIDFADPGTVTADFLAKEPGAALSLASAHMVFRYQDSFCTANGLEGYERLILDAMLGNQALFTDAAGIERLWEVSAPLQADPPPVQPYAQGSWGPERALHRLAAPYRWHLDGS
ncbi:MAG TPA: glucose-6-phosphate dehydrogenase [Streptosporangiaceae bacterium]|nr:glucose-6-phosphate dehydrogenase [Streptosporangiaceae bacterium]